MLVTRGSDPHIGGGTLFQVSFFDFLDFTIEIRCPPRCWSLPHLTPIWGTLAAPSQIEEYQNLEIQKKFPQKSGNWDFKLVKTAKMGQNLKPKILKKGHFRGLLPITKKGIFEKKSPARVCSPGAPPLRSGQT